MDKNKNDTANNKSVSGDYNKDDLANRPRCHIASERFVATGAGVSFTPPDKKNDECKQNLS